MFVQGSSTRPLRLQSYQPPPANYGQNLNLYMNQYPYYTPLDVTSMSNQLQYPPSPSQASSDLCSVPELDYSVSPPSSASITDVDPSENPSDNDISNNSYLVPLHCPRPLPYASPTFLQFDLPDVDEDLSFPPYTTAHKKRRFRRDDDGDLPTDTTATMHVNKISASTHLAGIAYSSHSAVTAPSPSSIHPPKRRRFHSDVSLKGKNHQGQPYFRREPHLSFAPHGTLLSVHTAAHHQASASQY